MIKVILFGESELFCEPVRKLLNKEKNVNVHSICYRELDLFLTLEQHKNIQVVILYHHTKRHYALQHLLVSEFPHLNIYNVSNILLETCQQELKQDDLLTGKWKLEKAYPEDLIHELNKLSQHE